MFKHILIATDGSELATKALHTGLEFAKNLGAKVTAIAITEPRTNLVPEKTAKSAQADEYDAALANAAQAVLTNAEAEARLRSCDRGAPYMSIGLCDAATWPRPLLGERG